MSKSVFFDCFPPSASRLCPILSSPTFCPAHRRARQRLRVRVAQAVAVDVRDETAQGEGVGHLLGGGLATTKQLLSAAAKRHPSKKAP